MFQERAEPEFERLAVARSHLIIRQRIFKASQAREYFSAAASAKLGHSTSHVMMLCGPHPGEGNRAKGAHREDPPVEAKRGPPLCPNFRQTQ